MSHRKKRWIAWVLSVSIFVTAMGQSVYSYTIQLTMPMCVFLAISKNDEIKQLRIDISDIQAKISAIRGDWRNLSFWKNLSYTWDIWTHYTQEIDNYSQIPDLQVQLKENMFQELSLRLEIKNTVQQAYYDVIEALYLLQMQKEETETLTQSISQMNYQRLQAQPINENDFILAKENVAASKQEEIKKQENVADAKKRLGFAMDMNIQNGYTFVSEFYTDLTEENKVKIDLERAIDYAIKADKESGLKYYEYQGMKTLVAYVEGRYRQKFGYTLWRIKDYLRSEVSEINFEDFRQAYDSFYSHIDDPWRWIRFLWFFPFIIIPIYGMWFRPSGLSTRYLGDKKYALYELLKEELKAEKAYLASVKTKRISIENAYTTLRNLYYAYEKSLTDLEAIKRQYQIALQKNQKGEMSFEQVETMRERFVDAQQSAFENLITYNTELSTFDYITCGYVWYQLTGESFSVAKTLGGLSYGEGETRPMYFISVNVEDMLVDFHIQMNDSPIEATHYELWTSTNKQIGTRTAISSKISHLPLTFVDEQTMQMKLYEDGILTYTAMFDGTQVQGYLEFEQKREPIAYQEDSRVGGTFQIENGTIDAALSLQFYEKYKDRVRFYDVVSITTGAKLGGVEHIPVNENFIHLSAVLNDFENLQIIAYNENGAMIQKFQLTEQNGKYVLLE